MTEQTQNMITAVLQHKEIPPHFSKHMMEDLHEQFMIDGLAAVIQTSLCLFSMYVVT
jgi:hypothetical protein